MTASDPRVGEIQARLDAASHGPWTPAQGATSDGSELCTTYEQKKAFLALSLNDDEDRPLWLVHNDEVISAATGDGPNAQANAEFIAAAPADVAYLLAELADRDEKLAKVELACDAMDAGVAIRAGDPRTKSHTATVIRAVIRESRAAVAAANGGGE